MPEAQFKTAPTTQEPPPKKTSKVKKIVLLGAVILFFYPTLLYRLIIPIISGSSATPVTEQSFESIQEIKSTNTFTLERQNYTYNLTPRANYELYGRIIDIDRYHGWWEKFAHGHDEGRMLYNALSPLDLVIGYQQMADPQNINRFKFSHEYRLMWWMPKTQQNISTLREMFNNFHIIPATPSIAFASKMLMRGDMIRLKGLLVDVNTPLYQWWKLKTGFGHSQYHKELYGGQYATMCFIVYVEEMQIGSRIYK